MKVIKKPDRFCYLLISLLHISFNSLHHSIDEKDSCGLSFEHHLLRWNWKHRTNREQRGVYKGETFVCKLTISNDNVSDVKSEISFIIIFPKIVAQQRDIACAAMLSLNCNPNETNIKESLKENCFRFYTRNCLKNFWEANHSIISHLFETTSFSSACDEGKLLMITSQLGRLLLKQHQILEDSGSSNGDNFTGLTLKQGQSGVESQFY